ncbi:MAG: hypothetical protein ACI9JR_002636 [Gammaproteobacteria bacterium]|jgi:hypothetical protein
MKNNKWLFCVTLLFTLYYSTAVSAERGRTRGVQQTYINDQFGEITDEMEIPCACQFDKHRSTAPKFLKYGGYLWACMEFDSNGFCLETARVKKANIQPEIKLESNSTKMPKTELKPTTPPQNTPKTTPKLITKSEINGTPVKIMDVIERGGEHRLQTEISDKFGDEWDSSSGSIPCPCIFDIARNLKPRGGKYKRGNYVWSCKVFDQYGLCREVKRISKRVVILP